MILDKAANTKKGRMFSEGWIEFEDRKVAKTAIYAAKFEHTIIHQHVLLRGKVSHIYFYE
jgi:hypothetical protein